MARRRPARNETYSTLTISYEKLKRLKREGFRWVYSCPLHTAGAWVFYKRRPLGCVCPTSTLMKLDELIKLSRP